MRLGALRRLFLQPAGWARSQAEARPVRADGAPLPWFTYGAIEVLQRILHPTDRVFEYGAGYSTLWWQDRVAEVASVDHDPAWCDELRPRLPPQARLTCAPAGTPWPETAEAVLARYFARPRRENWPYDPDRVVRRGLDDAGFRGYAAAILDGTADYDIVVVDGMARRLCTEMALARLAPGGIVILDNSNRSDYDVAFVILGEAGFRQIPFWGLVPGADFLTCTSIFLRDLDRLCPAAHGPNSFGLPEY